MMNDDEQFKRFAEAVAKEYPSNEALIADMERDFNEMKARWNKDTDTIGRILRAHLYVEFYMTEYLQAANPNLNDLGEARLSFAQKMNLLKANDNNIVGMVLVGVRHLNKIRNRLAHNLDAVVTVEDAELFLSQVWYKAMREANEKMGSPKISTEPLDVLEHFSEFAGTMLHRSQTKVRRVLMDALSAHPPAGVAPGEPEH